MRSDMINSSEIKAHFDKQFLASAVNEFEARQTECQPFPIFADQSERIPFAMKLDKIQWHRKIHSFHFPSLWTSKPTQIKIKKKKNLERKAVKWPQRVPIIMLILVSPCSSIQLTRIIPEQIQRNPHFYLTSATRRNCSSLWNRCCQNQMCQSNIASSLADIIRAQSVSVFSPPPRTLWGHFCPVLHHLACAHTFTWPCSCIIQSRVLGPFSHAS